MMDEMTANAKVMGCPCEWGWQSSVPAGKFSEVYGQPPVVGKVEKLDFTKEACRDRAGSESPRPGISTEFEASQQQAHVGLQGRASDLWKLLDPVGRTGSRHRDPDETALGLGRDELAGLASDGAFARRRLPLGACREPCDWLLVLWDVRGAGLDAPRVDDLFEF